MQQLITRLAQKNSSKIILVVLDGLGGLPLNGKTELETAATPHMDRLARISACGLHTPVAAGITPGSGPGHLSLFGYDPVAHQIGRGILEALGLGLENMNTDIAVRCNYATMRDGVITDRRAGRIPTDRSRKLTELLQEKIPNITDVKMTFAPGMEHRFHELLERATKNLLLGAHVFSEIAHATSLEDRRVQGVRLKALEREGDGITRQIFEALNTTFITPFDREDIRSLASDLDDILDHLESVAKYLVLFELGEAPAALRRFAEILAAMAEEIDKIRVLIWDMGNLHKVQESMVRISELENEGDSLYFAVISDLFKKGCTESIQILKWKEVYEGLEEACDRCKDFTHVVGNVTIKNA